MASNRLGVQSEVESTPAAGAGAGRPPAAAVQSTAGPLGREDLSGSTIMIVDDEPINIKTVQAYLQRMGYSQFVTTTDSTRALELARATDPQVILLDIMMPELDGLQVLRLLQQDARLRYVPVIILTAFCDPQTKREALELGATDFLAKPLDPSELAPRVRNALVVKAHQDHLENYAEQLTREVCRRTEELLASRQEAETRYLAGKAEIATEVLHNVGNALHSVNVSANLIQQKLRTSKVESLAKVAALIGDHAADLPRFFAQDPRAQVIPDYLSELASTLMRERHETLQEVQLLSKHLGHIEAVVATQQKYARVNGVNEPVSLPALVADALELSGILPNDPSLQIDRQFADLPNIVVNKQKVLQILVNLLRNAGQSIRRAHPSGGGRLCLRLAAEGCDKVRIEVTDNGVGIARDNLVRIFSHGFTTRRDGHGFGLHSSANTAKELGGSLHAASDGEGKGATFTLILPFERDKTSHD